jgi:hypothetical protein
MCQIYDHLAAVNGGYTVTSSLRNQQLNLLVAVEGDRLRITGVGTQGGLYNFTAGAAEVSAVCARHFFLRQVQRAWNQTSSYTTGALEDSWGNCLHFLPGLANPRNNAPALAHVVNFVRSHENINCNCHLP